MRLFVQSEAGLENFAEVFRNLHLAVKENSASWSLHHVKYISYISF